MDGLVARFTSTCHARLIWSQITVTECFRVQWQKTSDYMQINWSISISCS